MERAISHIQHGGKAEPVSRWSLNVIRQHVGGNQGESVPDGTDNEIFLSLLTENAARSWMPVAMDSEWSVDQEFPSLEDMFFGNAV